MLIKHVTNENEPDLLEKILSLIEKMKVLKVVPDSIMIHRNSGCAHVVHRGECSFGTTDRQATSTVETILVKF